MKAKASRALAQEPHLGLAWAMVHPGAEPAGIETRLTSARRLRAALLGLALGSLALAASVVAALVIASGTFHTSPGSLT